MNKEKLFLIDDGTATLIYHKLINSSDYRKKSKNKFFKSLRYNLFGLKCKLEDKVNFFSSFNLDSKYGETIETNSFAYLKSKLNANNIKIDETVYIIGQSLVESGYVSYEDYIKYLKGILIKFSNYKIVYFPHRYENIDDSFKNTFNDSFEIRNIDLPIELELINNEKIPKYIVSFFSTALYNINHIFNETNILALRLEKQDIQKGYDSIESIYAQFKKENISTFCLGECYEA